MLYNNEGKLEETQPVTKYGIFLYDEKDNMDRLVNTYPIKFNNVDDLIKYINSESFKINTQIWMNRNYNIVIRKFDCIEKKKIMWEPNSLLGNIGMK